MGSRLVGQFLTCRGRVLQQGPAFRTFSVHRLLRVERSGLPYFIFFPFLDAFAGFAIVASCKEDLVRISARTACCSHK
jgi:hypothetical protein